MADWLAAFDLLLAWLAVMAAIAALLIWMPLEWSSKEVDPDGCSKSHRGADSEPTD